MKRVVLLRILLDRPAPGLLNPGAQSDIYECHKNAQVVTFTTCLVNINVFALPELNVVRI